MKIIIIILLLLFAFAFRDKINNAFINNRDVVPKVFFGAIVILLTFSMIAHPKVIFQGSLAEIQAWWNIVFPSLLPFFIMSELLMSLGIVNFMGILLEPVMRPLFNVPGTGALVVTIGFTSGYPIGAMVTGRLRSEGLCTRIEAERLVSFTNNANPLFMLVAVSVGMFNTPALGYVIAGGHYLGNITLGFLLRFYGKNDYERINYSAAPQKGIIQKAFQELTTILRKEQRPPGKIVGDAVKNSITNLLNIGGFIILFAVIIRLLTEMGFIAATAGFFYKFLSPLGVEHGILEAIFSGFFEMTMGTKLASETAAPLSQQLVAIGIILAWSGLSILAQSASMIAHTDIRLLPFVICRFIHAFFAGIYTIILYNILQPSIETSSLPIAYSGEAALDWSTILHYAINGILLSFSILVFLAFLSVIIYYIRSVYEFFFKKW